MMESFVYQAAPMRVVFGSGRLADLAAELDRLGVKHALVLTTAQQKSHGEQIAALIGDRAAGGSAGAGVGTPGDVPATAQPAGKAPQAAGRGPGGGGVSLR